MHSATVRLRDTTQQQHIATSRHVEVA